MSAQESAEQQKGQTPTEQSQAAPSQTEQNSKTGGKFNAGNNYARQNRYNAGSSYYKPNMQWQQPNYYAGYPAYNPMQQVPMGMGIPTPVESPISTPTPEAAPNPVSESDPAAKAKAEMTRKSFVEEVKRRKAEMEKKKQEMLGKQNGGTEVTTTEKAPEEAKVAPAVAEIESKEVPEAKIEEKTNSEEDSQEEQPKVLTFAERMKLKKLQKEGSSTEAGTETPKEEATAETAEEEKSEEQEEPVKTEETFTEENQSEEASTEAPSEANDEDTEDAVEEMAPEAPIIIDENTITVSKILAQVAAAEPIVDIYDFKYPEGLEGPDPRYKKEHVKYTYGPTFLLQFKEALKVVADPDWITSTGSKIVIPPGMSRSNRSRDPSKFNGRGGDFRSNSTRDGSNTRSSSKRKSRRDDRRSNRSYTSRRDRERNGDRDDKKDDKPKEDVAPFVPTANRWVPKSKAKKIEKKLAPDGVTELVALEDIESTMKSYLNKLTLEKFDTISADILNLANQSKWETNSETLQAVIEQIFFKATDEPHWSSMYAQLCGKLVKDIDENITDEINEGKSGPKLVLHILVDRCHTEFQKGWTDKLPTNEDGTPLEPELMSDEYYQAAAAKRRGLGLVRFIGFLYRLNLLTGKMMFESFRKLMKELADNPSEEILESVVELLTTVGEQFETDSFNAGSAVLEGSALLDSLFAMLCTLVEGGEISNRIKFKLMDVKELREEKHWTSDKTDSGPKTIQQIHEDEERQRALKSSRSNSRRQNDSMRSNRGSRREPPASFKDKDNFVTTRSFSQRNIQKPPPKEEAPAPPVAPANMFSALMGSDEDDE